MKRLIQISPLSLLLTTTVVSAVPFLIVDFFSVQFYTVMDISSYLVFHNVVEFFSVMVSFSIFGLGWYAYDQNNDRHSLFLSVAFLAIGLMDFMHTLGYTGMPPLLTTNSPNKSTQFWIAVRLFSASAFLASAFISSNNKSRWLTKTTLIVAALGISFAVFTGVTFFPDYVPTTFIQGVGLTPFKKNSEFIIIILLILTSIYYWQRLSRSGDRLILYYLVAFVLCIYSELVFAVYKSVFDTYNVLGHIYKIAAFGLIYKGVFVSSVRKPYEELNRNRNMLSHIINSIPQSLFWKDIKSVYLGCNQVFARLAGIDTPDTIVGKSDFDLPWKGKLSEGYRADDREVMDSAVAKFHIIENLRNSNNEDVWIDTTKVPLTDSSGKVSGVLGIFEDITDRKLAEEKISRLSAIVESSDDAIISKTMEGVVTSWNNGAEKLFGYTEQEMLGKSMAILFPPERQNEEQSILNTISRGESVEHFETERVCKDGRLIDISVTISPIRNPQGDVIGASKVARNITQRKLAEDEKSKLEFQLQQSQKMESVGRLAGGVAHDFNNLLSVILGYSELALMKMEPSQPHYAAFIEIKKAAERSANLTRQLLAFARKQTVAPKVIDLNETISGMLQMLQRLIGEDIHLTWQPAPDLWPVKIDPSQIDQMLANLCVNARDAIADIGALSIETRNCTIDTNYCTTQTDIPSGEYTRISVSDNGIGMDKETILRIFEPFYTTKELGKGTGLGLATVYGIIKQNNGFINVYSEPGRGTTFTIFLPRHTDEGGVTLKEHAFDWPAKGNETILLVEDEVSILKMTALMLEGQGYTVLTAGNSGEAINRFNEHTGMIHLLMTDVIMPDMNGRDLVEKLHLLSPQLKCLFMSGYTSDIIAHHGVLDEGVYFVQKPFSLPDLAVKVREVLDGN